MQLITTNEHDPFTFGAAMNRVRVAQLEDALQAVSHQLEEALLRLDASPELQRPQVAAMLLRSTQHLITYVLGDKQ